MNRFARCLSAVLAVASLPALAQTSPCPTNYAQVTGSRLGALQTLQSGMLYVWATASDNSTPIDYSVPGVGAELLTPKKDPIVTGTLVNTLCLARSDRSSVPVGYHFQVRDTSPAGGNRIVLDIAGVPILADTFSLDSYSYQQPSGYALQNLVLAGLAAASQTPGGALDGSNTTFSLTGTPSAGLLYRNGVLQQPSIDYNIASGGNSLVFTHAPQPGDVLIFVAVSQSATSATGLPGSFGALTGSPYDNAGLNTALSNIAAGKATFSQLGGAPTDNASLAAALNAKASNSATITINNISCTLNGSCSIPTTAGSTTAATIQAALQSQSGCTSPGYIYSPATNTCTAPSQGGSTTAASIQTALESQSGCMTAGYIYSPQSNSCFAPPTGGNSSVGGVAQVGSAAATFPVGPRFAVKQYIATGDSITYGEGVANKTVDAYAYKIASGMGLPPSAMTNYGVDGYQSEDWALKEIFGHLNPTPSGNPLVTALILHNDLHWCANSGNSGESAQNSNTPGCLANAYSAMLAGLTYATIPINYKVLGNTPSSTSGSWAGDTSVIGSGVSSGSNGASESYTFSTTAPNQALYTWNGGADGDGGTASIQIDGSQVGTIATASTSGQCICTIDGFTNAVWGQRFVVSSAGSHTLKVTVTSSTGTIHWVGLGVAPVNAPPVVAPPSIFVGAPIYEMGYNDQGATNAFTAQLVTQINLLAGDGLLVKYIPTQSYQNVATDMSGSNVTTPNGMGDENSGTTCSAVTPSGDVGQHPNICGAQHIADAFLGTIQPAVAAFNAGASTGTVTFGAAQGAGLNGVIATNSTGDQYNQVITTPTFGSSSGPQTQYGYVYGAGTQSVNAGYYINATNGTATEFGIFGNTLQHIFRVAAAAPANAAYVNGVGTLILTPSTASGGAAYGAIEAGPDLYGQHYTTSPDTNSDGSGNGGPSYPVVYGAGLTNGGASGVFVYHNTSGQTVNVGFFNTSGSGNSIAYPFFTSAQAPNGSAFVDPTGSLNLAYPIKAGGSAGYTGTCASTATLTVKNGIVTNCQ